METYNSLFFSRIDDGPGRLARFLGVSFYERRAGKLQGARMTWGEVYWHKLGLALELMNFGSDGGHWSLKIHLLWLSAYIKLRFLPSKEIPWDDMLHAWGFTIDKDCGTYEMRLHWRNRSKTLSPPWSLKHKRNSIFTENGWVVMSGWENPENTIYETHPYKYVCRSGAVQKVNAKICVKEREWRPRWTFWLPVFRKISRTIEVEFDAEVGERAGSWKGGCIGCGYEMRPGELPDECLRRMEHERKFD